MEKSGALKGIRVIDFGQYIPGPMAAMMLADYGADVIHIDPPGGPRWNDYEINAVLMRGKRNIVLDLKKQDDLEIAKKLVATADVLIENFRPGVMDRLGLGKNEFKALNPSLIYCSIPGFSASDERAKLRGWEGVVEAEAGLYTDVFSGKTRFNALPLASIFAAVMACHSIISALIVREKCGRGQSIEVPMYDACFEAESTRGLSPRPEMKRVPPEKGKANSDYQMLKLLTRYPCKDGRYVQVTPPPRGAQLMSKAVFPESWYYEATLNSEQEAELAEMMKTRTALEWEKYGQEMFMAGIVKAQTSEEWMKDDSALSSRSVIPIEDPILGASVQPGVPSIMLSSGDSSGKPRTLPDSDREAILKELETLCPPDFKIKGEFEAPLKGIKVLDFCQVLAGPICGKILAEYGAEVLKINNPRKHENPVAMVGHETVNNGKLTTLIDLKSEEGKWILDNLIRECDIFHCNFSQEAYEHLGVTEDKLREKNPNIILSQVNVHSLGGWREWERGHEDLGEAVAGIACRYSGTVKPETIPLLVCDNLTGHNSALGVLLAVYHKIKTGEGQRVQACLSRSAALAQIPYMLDYKNKLWNEPSGPKATGWSIFNRIYATSDGYIFIAYGNEEMIKSIKGLEELNFSGTDAEKKLEAIIAEDSSAAWFEKLSTAGLDVRILRDFATEAMEEEYAKTRGLSKVDYHRGLGELRVVSCAPRLSGTPPIPAFPVAAEGLDTEEFLKNFRATHLKS